MLFLSGGAGVGKTRLIKCLYQALLRYLNVTEGENPDQITVLLAAPTGKAAYLINGSTIHAAFNIPANQGFQYRPLKYEYLNTLRYKLEHLKIVIIDEISMCGTRMFSFINQRLQEITGVSKPFGGLSIITIGDLYQLKPVMDSWIFKQPSGKSTEILSENLWQDYFQLYELTDIMRQKDDLSFAELLNRVREGNQTKEDLQFLKTRKIDVKDPDYPTNATHLLYFNKKVDAYNNELYMQSNEEKATVEAINIVIGDVAPNIKEQIKNNTKECEMGLSKVCSVAIGMRVELTVNLDLNDGLVNGAGGIVRKIERTVNKVTKIWIEFDDKNIGKDCRAQYTNKNKTLWTPITRILREFPVGKYKSCKVVRKQFPIRLAAAKTLHRAQGDTLKQVVIEFPTKKECHMHYVALSRAQKANDLFIIGDINGQKIHVSPEVKAEMARLRNTKCLRLCYIPLYLMEDAKFKICFHNCQSIHLHIDDVKADQNFLSSDLNMFVESKLCSLDKNERYVIPGFHLSRNDFSEKRTSYGSIVYAKDGFQPKIECLNYKTVEITMVTFAFVQCICIYSRPKESIKTILRAMEYLISFLNPQLESVIMGDFNIDISKNGSDSKTLISFMNSHGLKQLLTEITTDGKTTIDLVFTNIRDDSCKCGTLESYFSYHKPIWFTILK